MGWTSYRAQKYRNKSIDRKAECDAYFTEGLNAGFYRIVKSSMVGAVYYGAVECLKRIDNFGAYEDIPEAERNVFGFVILTSTDMRKYYNFSIKVMSEDMGPGYTDCPVSILKLLSPTDNEFANQWRKDCLKTIERKNRPEALKNLPIGSKIRFTYGDNTVELVKYPPGHQFKRSFWYNADNNTYMPAARIPDKYEVVTA